MSGQPQGKPAKVGPHGRAARMMPGEKPQDFKGTLKKTLSFIGAYKITLFVVFLFAIGSTVFSIVGPKVLSSATTVLFEGLVAKVNGTGRIDFDRIARILLITLGIYGVSAVCSFVQGWLMANVTQRLCFDLREAISKKINRLPFGYFEKNSVGDTLSRITNDVDTLGQSLSQGLTQLITSTVTVLGVTAMMFYINPIMTAVVLLLIPVTLSFIFLFVKISQRYFMAQQRTLGEINALVEETFSGHAVVRAFNQEKASIDSFNDANDRLYEAGWKSEFITSFLKPTMDMVGNLGYVAVAMLGSFFAVSGAITVGDIQAFIQYVKNFMQPLQQLAQISNIFQRMAAAAERIFEFLGAPEEEEAVTRVDIAAVENCVDFEQVRFGYDPDKPVIREFSAHVDAGQMVALVGPTGAGKTTMVKLLMRFYDVQGGSIRLGGHDVRAFSRDDIRSKFGMVLQDTWLYNGTIRDNIRYGNLTASDEEVERAAKIGCAHPFIQALPGGYDFVINEDATNLSQGQLQLITIARAVLADHDILILDEATSSVDTGTEKRIKEAMDNLMADRTCFVIAHRLSTIRNADLILMMEHGDIVEQGTHEELLAQDGAYAQLYNSQFQEQA